MHHNKSIGDGEADIIALKSIASVRPLLHKRCNAH